MKRIIVATLFSALFIGTTGCGKEKKTTTSQPNFGCRARTAGVTVPVGDGVEFGVGGVEYYPSEAISKSAAIDEARETYLTNNEDVDSSKVNVNCWSCSMKGLDVKARETCDQKVTTE
ncbi:MAG: hypothetical protein P1P90_00930 [Patescibacteria group bacterium]|nr:hypothetical protein [Patescibacteria group bacterium]